MSESNVRAAVCDLCFRLNGPLPTSRIFTNSAGCWGCKVLSQALRICSSALGNKQIAKLNLFPSNEIQDDQGFSICRLYVVDGQSTQFYHMWFGYGSAEFAKLAAAGGMYYDFSCSCMFSSLFQFGCFFMVLEVMLTLRWYSFVSF